MRIGILIAAAVAAFHLLPFANKYAAHLLAGRALESDFYSFYFAADAAFNHGRSPYSLAVVRNYERAFEAVVYPFLYPPTALPWLFPLSLAGFGTALALFQLVNLVSLVAVIALVQRQVLSRIEGPAWQFILVGALFAYESLSATLAWSQINLIILVLIMLAWTWSFERGADRRVAFCLFAAAALKTYPAAFVLIYLMRRRYGVIAWFAAFCTINLMIAVAVLPSAVWNEWIANVASTGGYGQSPFGLFSPSSIGNQNFNGLFTRLFGEGEQARDFTMVAAAFSGAMAFAAIGALRRAGDETFYGLAYALVSALVFLAAPLSWFHHFVFLIPALAYAAVYVSRMRVQPGATAMQAALVGALALCAYKWPAKDMEHLANPLLRSVPLLAPLLVFALVLALAGHAYARSRSARVRRAAEALGAAAAGQISR